MSVGWIGRVEPRVTKYPGLLYGWAPSLRKSTSIIDDEVVFLLGRGREEEALANIQAFRSLAFELHAPVILARDRKFRETPANPASR